MISNINSLVKIYNNGCPHSLTDFPHSFSHTLDPAGERQGRLDIIASRQTVAMQWRTYTLCVAYLITGLLLAKISLSHPQYSDQAIELHSTLAEFARRGQTTIELVPPLSIMIPQDSYVLAVAHVVMWLAMSLAFFALARPNNSQNLGVWLAAAMGFASSTRFLWIQKLDSLVLSKSISYALVSLALMISSHRSGTLGRLWTALGMRLPLVLFSSMLSSISLDLYTAYFVCTITQLIPVLKRVADRRASLVSIHNTHICTRTDSGRYR